MAGYKTGAPELLRAAKQMEDTNQELQGNLKALQNVISSVQGAWAGQAATAFHTLMERFNEDGVKLNQSLLNISDQVKGSAAEYTRQEEESQQSLSSITQTLGGGA